MKKPKRITVEKIVLTVAMTVWLLFLPMTGYESNVYDGSDVPNHAAYMLSHANVWHLLGNVFVLWLFRGELYLLESMLIAFVCSFLPAWCLWPIGVTVGFSGVIFAILGIKWGAYCRDMARDGKEKGRAALSGFLMKALPFALVGIVIPHINWCLHLYCLLVGFIYGRDIGGRVP